MGADVHFFLEKRTNNGPWQLDSGQKDADNQDESACGCIPALEARSYLFFGLLAGVRSYHTPVYPVRGIPKDASDFVSKLWASSRDSGYHTPSWLKPKELKLVLDRYFKIAKKDTDWYDAELVSASPFKEPYRIDCSALDYIKKQLDWEKAENLLLGSSNKTEFRFVFWFDS